MAGKLTVSVIVCIIVSILGVDGADKAPAPASSDCDSVVASLATCLSFVKDGSKEAEPVKACCTGLDHVLKTTPHCLCDALKSSAKVGVHIDVAKALSLPSACKLTSPDLSNCGLALTPAAAPAPAHSQSPAPSTTPSSPAPSTPSSPSPSTPSTPADAPVAADEHPTPSTPASSASALFPISAASILLGLFVATF